MCRPPSKDKWLSAWLGTDVMCIRTTLSGSICVYAVYAKHFNLCITKSFRPCSATAVTDPYVEAERTVCRCQTNIDCVSREPLYRVKSRPDVGGLSPIVPRKTPTPSVNGSVLIRVMQGHICNGAK